jgi:hypothetical protein
MKNEGLKILFIDRITFFSLLRIWAFRHSLQTIYYFDSLEPPAKRLISLFQRFGLLRVEARQIEHHIGEVRDETGGLELINLRDYARSICSKIRREQLTNNPLIEAMASVWPTNKILLYFEKLAEQEVGVECLRIGLVKWILENKLHLSSKESLLLVQRRKWFSYLEAHAVSRGIRLMAYRGGYNLRGIASTDSRLLQVGRKWLLDLKRNIESLLRRSAAPVSLQDTPDKSEAEKQPSASRIAIRYGYRKLGFAPTERSEFFWLNGSGIPYSEVLLCGYITDSPLDPQALEQIDTRGIKLMGRGPGIQTWFPTKRILRYFLEMVLQLTRSLLSCLAHGQWVSPYYLFEMLILARDYAYWYDFYDANHVRINVGTLNSTIAQVLALDALGAVSMAYQYSSGVGFSTPTLLTAGENVQFVFAPVFEQAWQRIETPVNSFVSTGFIYDSAIQELRGLDRIGETRKKLQANGASFILCYFDENSLNRWDIFHWDDDATDDYEYLLNWLLEDPTLGLVFKPKVSTNLFKRISRISGLIDQASQTGRCKFLISDTLVGSVYPAEAALMADFCVGWLSGSTAALEARLAGVSAVLIDPVGLRRVPFYNWNIDGLLFTDWDSLRAAIEQYRTNPEAYPDFGTWSPELRNLDPFQDGQASLRMGQYIRWVYDALKQGASKQTALQIAAEKFSQRWGKGHINMNN